MSSSSTPSSPQYAPVISSSPASSIFSNRYPSVDQTAIDDQQGLDGEPCRRGCSTGASRNLVVCIDGTANEFGLKNSHIVELYSHLVKNKRQLTYYNSGIGTSGSQSHGLMSSLMHTLENKVDMAIALSFEKIIIGAYKWLAENYIQGDRIFLFGFSRGAYQVRVLAGMIDRVGLIHKGNEEQIHRAWEFYSDPKAGESTEQTNFLELSRSKSPSLQNQFKRTFSSDARVHFVGVFDTVSSVGLVRGKILPGTDDPGHICFFRHALALDERRVKFLPEYARGGVCLPDNGEQFDPADNAIPPKERVKEFWFAGSHSDIGGGNVDNVSLNSASPPLLWISCEGIAAGLLMKHNGAELDIALPSEVHDSLTLGYKLLECLPVRHASYEGREDETRSLHLGRGRQIQPGQKVHASVAFSRDKYIPKAVFPKGSYSPRWEDLINLDNPESTDPLELSKTPRWRDWLEMDMFDVSAASTVVDNLEKSSIPPLISVYHLTILTRFAEGCHAILKVRDAPQRVFRVLSQVRILQSHRYQIDIVNALVRFAPDYGITCLDEERSIETIVRLLRNSVYHDCVHRFVLKFCKGGAYKGFMRLRLYEQLANALAARKAITDEFFVNELRVLLAQEHAPRVIAPILDELNLMTRRPTLQEHSPHNMHLFGNHKSHNNSSVSLGIHDMLESVHRSFERFKS